MSLSILFSDSSRPIELCARLGTPLFPNAVNLNLSEGMVKMGDFLGCWGGAEGFDARKFFIRLPLKTPSQVFNFPDKFSGRIETVEVSHPTNDSQENRVYDEAAYGNFYHKAYSILLKALRGISYPDTSSEHFTRHYTFSGQLISPGVTVPLESVDFDWRGTVIPSVPSLSSNYRGGTVSSIDPLSLVYSGDIAQPAYDLEFIIDKLKNYGTSEPYIGVNNYDTSSDSDWISTVSAASLSRLQNGDTIISYHMHCIDTTSNVTYDWDTKVTFRNLVHQVAQSNPVLGNLYVALYNFNAIIDFHYDNFIGSPGASRTGPVSGDRQIVQYVWTAMSIMPSSETIKYDMSWANGIKSNGLLVGVIRDFSNLIRDNWNDILPSATFSTVDALLKMEGSVNNNVLQTIYKIPEIASALPDIMAAVDILGSLMNRNVSGSTIREILDLATSTHLQASFQWQPYYLLLTKYLPKIVQLLSKMFEPKHLLTGYGSFTFDISNDLGRDQVHLVTRSKVIVDVTLTGALSAALSLDAAGLLPRFSRAWDLIPFTFVVNWITGLGKRISEMETIGFASLVPASYVHSYTLTSPFQKGELEVLNASSFGGTPAGLKVYIRDVTLYPPVPRLSRFAFGIPSKYPSAGLVGSLLYQLFLS